MWSASDYRAMARKSLNGKWPLSILVCLIGVILGDTINYNFMNFKYSGPGEMNLVIGNQVRWSFPVPEYITTVVAGIATVYTVYAIFTFLIGGAIEIGVCRFFAKQADNQKAEVSDVFYYFNYFGKALGLRIVMAVFVVLWTILLIIPGIIAAYRYSMATYIMSENPDIGIMDAIEESKQMMDGRKGELFCLDLSFIGWAILCCLTFGIGYIFLNPYIQSARAHFYLTNKPATMNNGDTWKEQGV